MSVMSRFRSIARFNACRDNRLLKGGFAASSER
jgi:hypothetical protein